MVFEQVAPKSGVDESANSSASVFMSKLTCQFNVILHHCLHRFNDEIKVTVVQASHAQGSYL